MLGLHLQATEDGDVARPQELPGQGGVSVTLKLLHNSGHRTTSEQHSTAQQAGDVGHTIPGHTFDCDRTGL